MDSSAAEKQPLLGPSNPHNAEQAANPSLLELQRNASKAQRTYMRAWSRTTSGRYHKALMYCVTLVLALYMLICVVLIASAPSSDDSDDERPVFAKVPLEAHIMSKCPDARDCLRDMIMPTMQRVSDKIDFTLSYIGRVTGDDAICMHGSEECLGNIIELCAAKLYPTPQIYLGFTWCLTKDYHDIPKHDLISDCALEHGISLEKLDECAVKDDGESSLDMLAASFNRSSAAGVTKSCTVRLGEKIRCIRDGGKWSDCEGGSTVDDLVSDIEALYDHGRKY